MGKDCIIFFYIQTCYFATGLSELSYSVLFLLEARELKTGSLPSFCRFCKNGLGKNINKRHARCLSHLKDTKWLLPYELGEIPYDVIGTVNLKSNISKTREYFSAKLGKYLFLHFLNRMTSLLCQFISFFKGGRVPLKETVHLPNMRFYLR